MLADTAFSPWHNDVFLGKDHNYNKVSQTAPGLATHSNLNLTTLDNNRLHSCHRFSGSSALGGTSCCTSVASSECSDDLCLDLHTDLESPLFSVSEDCDYLSPSVLNLLDQEIGSDNALLDTFDWIQSDLTTALDSMSDIFSSSDAVPSTPPSPQQVRKRSHSESASNKKTWNQMSSTEQVHQVEDLTRIISNEMGLREQLEIIRIINPHARVAPTDTEFVIDLDCLSEEKLQEVREFIHQHTQGHSSTVSDASSDCSNASPSQKKQTRKQRRTQIKEMRERRKKEQKQLMKEKRSGLFAQEEVLALTSSSPTDDDDALLIDVLE